MKFNFNYFKQNTRYVYKIIFNNKYFKINNK